MHTEVEFRSSLFPPDPDEAALINPGRWGRRLAFFLQARLRDRGILVGTPRTEDWGWLVPIEHRPFSMWIGCGNYDEFDSGFLCFIEPNKPRVWRWFRWHDTRKAVVRVSETLNEVLRAEPGISRVRWWDPHEGGH